MDYADLREGIYYHLAANVPDVAGRVYEGYTPRADREKPNLLFSFLGEMRSINISRGTFIQFEVLVCGEEGSYQAIDPIADAVISCLHKQIMITPGGRYLRPEYRSDTRNDWWDEATRSNIIRMVFWLPSDLWI